MFNLKMKGEQVKTKGNKLKTVLSAVVRNSFLPVFILTVAGVYALNQQPNDDQKGTPPFAGKLIYESKCGQCHKLFEPDKYNAQQWSKWVDKMAPKAKLTEVEKGQVYQYLSATTKKK